MMSFMVKDKFLLHDGLISMSDFEVELFGRTYKIQIGLLILFLNLQHLLLQLINLNISQFLLNVFLFHHLKYLLIIQIQITPLKLFIFQIHQRVIPHGLILIQLIIGLF